MASTSDFRFFNTPAPPSAYQQAQNTAKQVVSFAEDSGKLMGQKYNLAMQDQQRAARYALEDFAAQQAAIERERRAKAEAAARGDFDSSRDRYTMPGEQARAMDRASIPDLEGILNRDIKRPSIHAQEFGLGRGFRPVSWSDKDENLLLNAEKEYEDRIRNPSWKDRQFLGVNLSGIDPEVRAAEAFRDLRRETDAIAAARRQRVDPSGEMGKPVIPSGQSPIGRNDDPVFERLTAFLEGRPDRGTPDIGYYTKSPDGNPYNVPKTPEQEAKIAEYLKKINPMGAAAPAAPKPVELKPAAPAGAKPAAPAAAPGYTGIPLESAANPAKPRIPTPSSEKEAEKTTGAPQLATPEQQRVAKQQAAARLEQAIKGGYPNSEAAARRAAIAAGATEAQVDSFVLRKRQELEREKYAAERPERVEGIMKNVERLQGEGFSGLAELYRNQAKAEAGRRPEGSGGPRPNLNTRFLTRRAYSRGLEQQYKDNPLFEQTMGSFDSYQNRMIEELSRQMEEAQAAQAAQEAQEAQARAGKR